MFTHKINDSNYDVIINKIALKDSYFELLSNRYTAVASYIDEHKSNLISNIEVYPQGSVKQGTVIKHHENNSFDVDVVIEFEANIDIYSQKEIRDEIKGLLSKYININGMKESLVENKRSYSILYSDNQFDFHIDFTPVIKYNEMYYLTNNEKTNYHFPSTELERTNPRALYIWFNDKNTSLYKNYYQKSFIELKKSEFTKLQKLIMLTKYSKDLMLKSSLKSIILTVVMAETFNYSLSYEENFENFKKKLIVEYSKQNVYIANPTESSENFADKFNYLTLVEKEKFIELLKEWEMIGDEFYTELDYSHVQVINAEIDRDIEIHAYYTKNGFRSKQFESGEKIKKGKQSKARFSIVYENISDYDINWQVTNEGYSARKNNSLGRGDIELKHSCKMTIEEPISFAGQHWIRCVLTNKYTQKAVMSPRFKVYIT